MFISVNHRLRRFFAANLMILLVDHMIVTNLNFDLRGLEYCFELIETVKCRSYMFI